MVLKVAHSGEGQLGRCLMVFLLYVILELHGASIGNPHLLLFVFTNLSILLIILTTILHEIRSTNLVWIP